MKKRFDKLFPLLSVSLAFLLYSCESPVVSWNSSISKEENEEDGFSLKVYVENSGSMDGYMCPGSELKDAVYGYVSALDSYADTTSLYYINSQIIPYNFSLKRFIRDLNPQSFHQAGGNTAHSDIAEMFTDIITNIKDNEVAFFISDCILDVPNGDATKFFYNKKIELRNAVVKGLNKNENLAIEVLRLQSTFEGRYYYTSGFEILKDVRRPYYMWIIGDKLKLATIHEKVPFSEIEHGYQYIFSWSTPGEVPFEICNKQGRVYENLLLRNAEKDGKYHFLLKVNLSNTLLEQSIPCENQYYKNINPFLKIEKITPIHSQSTDYTHVMDISLETNWKPSAENLSFSSPILPTWVDQINDDEGRDIQANMNKTTGIKYLIEGVADAYRNRNELFEIQFVINKQ